MKPIVILAIVFGIMMLALFISPPAQVYLDTKYLPCTYAGCELQSCPSGYTMGGCGNVGLPEGSCNCITNIACDTSVNCVNLANPCSAGQTVQWGCVNDYRISDRSYAGVCDYTCVSADVEPPIVPPAEPPRNRTLWETFWNWLFNLIRSITGG